MASTPPGYSSGLELILREPHCEHFMCLLTSGTGVSAGSWHRRRSDIALVTAVGAVDPQQLVVADEIGKYDRAGHVAPPSTSLADSGA